MLLNFKDDDIVTAVDKRLNCDQKRKESKSFAVLSHNMAVLAWENYDRGLLVASLFTGGSFICLNNEIDGGSYLTTLP